MHSIFVERLCLRHDAKTELLRVLLGQQASRLHKTFQNNAFGVELHFPERSLPWSQLKRIREIRVVVAPEKSVSTMESLLSVSFDNISSRDSTKIRKGLRQIEGLLAQICLSKANPRSPHKRKSSVLSDNQQPSPKKLRELKSDPAFREFFRLQEGFQCNGVDLAESEEVTRLSLLTIVQSLPALCRHWNASWAWAIHRRPICSSLQLSNFSKASFSYIHHRDVSSAAISI